MAEDYDSENIPESSGAVDDDGDQDASSSGEPISESRSNEEVSSGSVDDDSNNNNEDGVMVSIDNNGSGDSDGVVVSEDAGREDMFVDASEDLGADGRESTGFVETRESIDEKDNNEEQASFRGLEKEMQNDYMVDEMERLRAMLDKTINEKESIAREYKDEMEMAAKGIAHLRHQMRGLINKQLSVDENNNNNVSFGQYNDPRICDTEQEALTPEAPLHEMMHECSVLLRNVMDEIGDLNRKATEVSVSHDVVDSYLNSVHNESLEAQVKKDQYMEDATNRMLYSLASVVYVGDLEDNSVMGKISHLEKSAYALIENYNWFLYQSDELRQRVAEVRPDLAEQNDYGMIFAAAHDMILEFKKEPNFVERLQHMENENSKLTNQLEEHKTRIETTTVELERLKAELEQEKNRYLNTKEKLSLAVTKGKALVQQRDSLKQVLAEKTGELDKCLVSLQEKSSALEAAELIKEEWVKCQIFTASLQEMLAQKDAVLEKSEDVLAQSGIPMGLKSPDVAERIRWLVDERNALKDVSQKFHQLADALLSIDLPENFSFSDLESRLGWLRESFDQAKTEITVLQDELVRAKEVAHNEMDRLAASFSTLLVENDYVKGQLEDIMTEFEETVGKEHRALSQSKELLRILLEASGLTAREGESLDTIMLAEKCFQKLKEEGSPSLESSQVNEKILETLQALLYVKEQDLTLCEKLLEEEGMTKSETDKLFEDLGKASEEVFMLKEERDNLRKDLERSEEKYAMIREKLSMAVKKGKGLVQERENLKKAIDEKSSEIEKLKLELRQQESAISEFRSQNNSLSAQVQRIPDIEADLMALREQREQSEKGLAKTNSLLQTVMNSIDGIILPVGSDFEEPFEKVKRLSGFFSDCQAAKAHTERELDKAKSVAETLSSELSKVHQKSDSLEDALSIAETKISQLEEGRRNLEEGKKSIEEQLERAVDEARSNASMFTEADVARKSLENALSLAESNISSLNKEKEEAEFSKAATEAELEKMKEEISALTGRLTENFTTVSSLEAVVSQLETRIVLLTEEKNEAEIGRTNAERELTKLKEEADTKLQDASSGVKSLEEALAKAKDELSVLAGEKQVAEQEISTLNAKLNACMEELAGTTGSLESRSLELVGHLKDLELLVKDESTLLSLKKVFEEELVNLKEMDILFRNIKDLFAEMSLENDPVSEESSYMKKPLSIKIDDSVKTEIGASGTDTVESTDISSYVQQMVQSFHTRNKTFSEKFNGFFSFMSECNASVLGELRATKDRIATMAEHMISLKQKMENMEKDNQELGNAVSTMERDISVVLSACTDATKELQFEVDKYVQELESTPEHEVENQPSVSKSNHAETVEKLLSATMKTRSLCEHFEKSRNILLSTVDDLQNKLNEAKEATFKAEEERDLYRSKVSKLEMDLETLQNLCSEMQVNVDDHQGIAVKLSHKEAEISSLHSALTLKEREVSGALLWISQVKDLLDEVNGVEVPLTEPHIGDLDPQDSAHIKKLIYIIDNFTTLQNQCESLLHDKEKLQSTLAAQLQEIEHLKEQASKAVSTEQELENTKSELFELEVGLERIILKLPGGDVAREPKQIASNRILVVLEQLITALIMDIENLKLKVREHDYEVEKNATDVEELTIIKGQLFDLEVGVRRIIHKLGGEDVSEDQKHTASIDLLGVLEELAAGVVDESENSKSRSRELDMKLLESQKFVDELLSKVKGLEDSLRSRAASPEIVQERSIFEAPSQPSTSETSIIEDKGSVPNPTISPVPSAANVRSNVRTMWKGSSDHIAVNIDSESGRLIGNKEEDEDKGHVFKSLNTSGLIPSQGRMIADRVDGIWVTGGRMLMSRPRARLGLIAYSLFLHLWVLAAIL